MIYIYFSLLAAILIVGLIRWRHLTFSIKLIFCLVVNVIIIELFREYYRPARRMLVRVNMIQEFVIHLIYYRALISKAKRPFLWAAAAFFVGSLTFVYWKHPQRFSGIGYDDIMFYNVAVVCWTFLFFIDLIQRPVLHSLRTNGDFWINCGHLLFYPATLMIFGMGLGDLAKEFQGGVVLINKYSNLALYVLYLVGIIVSDKNREVADHRQGLEAMRRARPYK